jgi:catecholate siderophore receptor
LNAYDNKSDPNTFENTEFGVKYDLPNGLSFTAAFFNVEANKPQTDDNGATFYKEKSDVSGFELQLLGALTDKWYLSAGYTSLDAESSSGGRLREAPEDMFSIWNNYLLSDRLAVNLGVIYQGESQIGSSATPILPDYTRVDVGATYLLTDNTRLQVNIENITDELYFPNSHSTHQASVGAPVNATFGITSSF